MTDTALTIFLCKPAGLEERNLALGVEVLLVADEDDDDVWTGQWPRVHQPVCQRVERLTADGR